MKEPRRLLETPDGGELSKLFRGAQPLRPLPDAALNRVRASVEALGWRRPSGRKSRVVLGAATLFASGFALAWVAAHHPVAPALPSPASKIGRSPSALVTPRDPPPFTAQPSPPPTTTRSAPRQPRGRTLPSAVTKTPSASPSSSALAQEAQLVGQAVRLLEQSRQPAEALTVLALHQQRFPDGQLQVEASVARLNALLALGRQAEALATLDAIEDAPGLRGAELKVLRAELLVRSGDCAEAGAAAREALARPLSPQLSRRAQAVKERCPW